MAETQQVIIEFLTDTTQVDTAINKLEKTGAVDSKLANGFKQATAEISKQATEIQKTAAATVPLKKNLEDVSKATKGFTGKFMADFQKQFLAAGGTIEDFKGGVQDALDEAGVSMEEFTAAIEARNATVEKSSISVKQRLAEVTKQLQLLKVQGQDNTEQYKQLTAEAGNLKDAIGDVAQETKNAAANSQALDGFIGVVQGIAGGFAVAQGAAALFGDENEELQQVLLKVNSAMAILQGLQQLTALRQGESAAATFLQTTAQQIYNVVVGESIGLLKALRIAFALTGVGLFILGITALVQWMSSASKATKQLTKDFTKFNLETQRDLENFKNNLNEVKRSNEEQQATLKAGGALQSQITKANIKGMKEELVGVFELQKGMRARKDEAVQILTQMATGERKFNEALSDEAQKTIDTFNDLGQQRLDIGTQVRIQETEFEKQTTLERLQAIADSFQGRLALAKTNSKQEFELQKQSARAQAAVTLEEAGQNVAKRLLIERELQKQLRDIDAESARVRQQERIDSAERELLKVQQASKDISERTTQEEIDAQKNVIQEKARLDLLQQGLLENGRQKIIEQSIADQLQLQKDFNKQSTADALADLISRNNAQLDNINLSNIDRLHLQEENLVAQAQIEIDSNQGLADKIKEIRSKLNSDLNALRLAAIQQELAEELALNDARTGALRRSNERIEADEQKSLQKRIAAINQLAVLDIQKINIKQDVLEQQLKEGLVSQKDYNLQYAQLKDEEVKITEDAEKKKTDLIKAENIKRIQITLNVLGQIADVVQAINESQTQQEQNRIEGERQRVAELLEAGAITEKEAERRNKKIDQEEKAAKRKQAQREKDMATFRALLAIPQAFLTGLAQGGPILGAIYAAIAAAEAIVIASRPIPKFAKGKKDKYEGPGEIGEAGMELMQHDGQLYLAKKRTLVWLGKNDKVYNPTETKEMLMPVVDKQLMQWQASVQRQPDAKEIAGELVKALKKMPGTNVNIDEHGLKIWVQEGQSRKNYMDKRYSSK